MVLEFANRILTTWATILQLSDSEQRAKMLEVLLPRMSQSLLRQTLAIIEISEDQYNCKTYAQEKLVKRLVNTLLARLTSVGDAETALAAAHSLTARYPYFFGRKDHIEMLLNISHHASNVLREKILQEAIDQTEAIEQPGDRAETWALVLSHASQSYQAMIVLRMLVAIRAAEKEVSQDFLGALISIKMLETVLLQLAPYFEKLPEDMIREALSVAMEIGDGESRVRVLTGWLAYLPPQLRTIAEKEALTFVEQMKDSRQQASFLRKLVVCLSDPLRAQAIRLALKSVRTMRKRLSQRKEHSTLVFADEMEDEIRDRAEAENEAEAHDITTTLLTLIPFLSDAEREDVLQQTIGAARRVLKDARAFERQKEGISYITEPEGDLRASKWVGAVMIEVAAYLPESQQKQLLHDLLVEVQKLKTLWIRAEAYIGLLPTLSQLLRNETAQKAFLTVRKITDINTKIRLLEKLIPHVTGQMRDEIIRLALESIGSTEDSLDYATKLGRESLFLQILDVLPPSSREALIRKRLAEIKLIPRGGERAISIERLAPYLSETLLKEALPDASLIEDTSDQMQVLVACSTHLSAMQQEEIVSAIRGIDEATLRARMFAQIASSLPTARQENVLVEALTALWEIENEAQRVDLLKALIPPFIALGYIHEIMGAVQKREMEWRQSDLHLKVASQMVINYPERIIAFIHEYKIDMQRLLRMTSHLPEALHSEINAWAKAIEDPHTLSQVLPDIVFYLSPLTAQELLAKLRSITNREDWIDIVLYLIPALPIAEQEQVRDEVLEAIADLNEGQKWHLVRLVRHATGNQLQKVLSIAQRMKDDRNRIEALLEIAPYLSEALRDQLLKDILPEMETTFDNRFELSRILAVAAPFLSKSLVQRAIALAHAMMDILDPPTEAITSLACRLAELGFIQEAIKEVAELPWIGSSWNAYEVPAIAGCYQLALKLAGLNEPDAALQLLSAIPYSYIRNSLAIELAPILAKSGHIEKAWTAAWLLEEDKQPADILAILTPYLVERGKDTLFPIFSQTLRRSAARPRKELLANIRVLVPVIASLGGSGAVEHTVQAIRDVGNWWP